MLYFINSLIWLASLSLIILAIYLHYFTNTEKRVDALVVGGIFVGIAAFIMSISLIEKK